jgi:uncharacterized membrane protein YjdF
MSTSMPHDSKWTGTLPVALFTGVYLLAAIVLATGRDNYEFLIYIGSVLVIVPVIGATHAKVRLTHGALWCLSVWGFMHMCGGLASVPANWPIKGDKAVLYNLWLIPEVFKYDNLVHAFGFGVTSWVCWQGLRAMLGNRAEPTWGRMLLVWAAGLGFGALNEVIEFTAVMAVPDTNVGGYRNTGWDLVANLAGCSIAVLLLRFGRRG